jgi:RNA polymerase sigma-70 factor (ECF subfamily)
VALNALRRRRRFTWLPWQAGQDAPHAVRPDLAESVDRHDAIEAALDALTPAYRAPLLLYSHYGFSVSEVAEALGIREGAVKTRLYRAREMFRRAYEGEVK